MSDLCYEFTRSYNQYQAEYKLNELITNIENHLKMLPDSGFHKIVGKDLLHLTSKMAGYLENFYDMANQFYQKTINEASVLQLITSYIKPVQIKAIHCEMNNFKMSTEEWFMDVFSYSCPPCEASDPFDWFTHFDYFALESIAIKGFEDLQKVFGKYHEYYNYIVDNLELSSRYCEILIILRLQEVIIKVIESTRCFSQVPFYITVFNNDLVLETKMKKGQSNLSIIKNERGGAILGPGRYSYFG